MDEPTAGDDDQPTLLRVLLRQRYRQSYPRFCQEYDRVARQLDKRLVNTEPSRTTFKRWLRGDVTRLPNWEACAVLDAMFPEHRVEDLFRPHRDVGLRPTPGPPHDHPDAGGLDEVKRRELLGGAAAMTATLSSSSRVLQALEIVAARDADTLSAATDFLDELVHHYSERLPVTPPTEMYGDLLDVRSFADSLLERSNSSTRRRSDLVAATGWLSNLLAVATSYMGDHGSSLIWCLDAERHSHESGNRDIAGWAVFNRAMMAYYQGRTRRSIELASDGQEITSRGTVAHAKLAAHEMRARAMIGDDDRMIEAKKRATAAISELPSGVATTGVFSIALSEDPPYTATSLLLLNRFEEAASATESVIQAAYRTDAGDRNRQSSNYARTLLILGLARAGIGDIDGAVAAGRDALSGGGLVWPTRVLARKLDQALTRDDKSAPEIADYRDLHLSLSSSVAAREK